jgi:hypothetical protein
VAIVSSSEQRRLERAKVGVVLNTLHYAASKGAAREYLRCFSEDAIFIGTDADEHWKLNEFAELCKRHFKNGRGWTYVSYERRITLNEDFRCAWFYERLKHKRYVDVRGSGVLIKIDNTWRIAQYVLSFPIPNELALPLAKQVRSLHKK